MEETTMALCKKSKAKKAQKQAEKFFSKAAKNTGKKADKLTALAEKKAARAEKLTGKKVSALQKAAEKQGKNI